MEKFIKLSSLCKCSVQISVNDHRDVYETVEQFLDDNNAMEATEIEPRVLQKMIELDTVVWVQFYPITPIGFYCVYHYDIDTAMDMALEIMDEQ